MKKCLFFCTAFFLATICAQAEPTERPCCIKPPCASESHCQQPYQCHLQSFTLDEEAYDDEIEVSFLLDNGWELQAYIPIETDHVLEALKSLSGTRARFQTSFGFDTLSLSLENPLHPGHDKIILPVTAAKEIYKSLPTIVDMQTVDYFFSSEYFVTLSDGTTWNIPSCFGGYLQSKWSMGDRVLVSHNYTSPNVFTLINVDVFTYTWADILQNRSDFRSTNATRHEATCPKTGTQGTCCPRSQELEKRLQEAMEGALSWDMIQ